MVRWASLILATLPLVIIAGGAVPCLAEDSDRSEERVETGSSPVESALRSVDESHNQLERSILETVIRFDDFFGNIKTEDQRQTRYDLRWRNSFRLEEGRGFRYGTTARANIVLSRISDRLRVAISGENDTETASQRLPEDPGTPGLGRTTRTTRVANTELRYSLMQDSRSDWFLGAGLRIILPPEIFFRTRFQHTHNIHDNYLFRVRETLFLKNTTGPGETTEIVFEHLLGTDSIARWATSATLSHELSGMEWGSELSLMKRLAPQTAVTVTGGVYGNTGSSGIIGTYKILSRYRQNFLRDWLFFEIEPEVSWPRRNDGTYRPQLALTLYLEIVFKGVRGDSDQ